MCDDTTDQEMDEQWSIVIDSNGHWSIIEYTAALPMQLQRVFNNKELRAQWMRRLSQQDIQDQ